MRILAVHLVLIVSMVLAPSLYAGDTGIITPIVEVMTDDIDIDANTAHIRQETMVSGCQYYRINLGNQSGQEAFSLAITSYTAGKNAHIAIGRSSSDPCLVYRVRLL